MVITMTNRLLAMVIAIALSSGIAAHAAQDPHKQVVSIGPSRTSKPLTIGTLAVSVPAISVPVPTISLPAARSLPAAIHTAASQIQQKSVAFDASGAIRAASQRDHVALEHLRGQGAALRGTTRAAFNYFVSDEEATLVELEKTALAANGAQATASIAAMDKLVAAAQASLAREQHLSDIESGRNQTVQKGDQTQNHTGQHGD